MRAYVDSWEVRKNTMKRFFLALALVLAACGIAVAEVVPIPEPGVYWLFTGSGTIDGESFTSVGWWQITVETDGTDYYVSNYTITERRTFASGRVEDGGGGCQGFLINSYTEQGFSFQRGSSTLAFGIPNANNMTMTDTSGDAPDNIATYTATRSTVEPTTFPPIQSGSGGGGCSVGLSPLFALLALPLLLKRK
jgi:Synergist-CTERM protein sorting domain-containing protein